MGALDKIKDIDLNFVKKGASSVKEEDLGKVAEKADAIKGKFESKGPLGRFVSDAKTLLALIKDYYNGDYREIPWWAISAVGFTMLYVLSPVDLIPDPIPVVGYLDDAAVVGICLMLVEQELAKYQEWKLATA